MQGSYLVMDADYARNFSEDERPFHEFKHSLFVLTTVQSRQVIYLWFLSIYSYFSNSIENLSSVKPALQLVYSAVDQWKVSI